VQREDELCIIERVRQGDVNAFEQLVKAYERGVYTIAYKLLKNSEDAQDAAQEAFVKAYSKLDTFRGEAKFSAWLYKLTSNCCVDALRRRREELSLTTESKEGEITELEIPDLRQNPELVLEKKELREAVRENLERLPAEYRRALILRELGELSYAEIAEELSVDIGTVKSRIFRARKKLHRLLCANGNFFENASSDIGEGRCAE